MGIILALLDLWCKATLLLGNYGSSQQFSNADPQLRQRDNPIQPVLVIERFNLALGRIFDLWVLKAAGGEEMCRLHCWLLLLVKVPDITMRQLKPFTCHAKRPQRPNIYQIDSQMQVCNGPGLSRRAAIGGIRPLLSLAARPLALRVWSQIRPHTTVIGLQPKAVISETAAKAHFVRFCDTEGLEILRGA
jgi:hypothetical protein